MSFFKKYYIIKKKESDKNEQQLIYDENSSSHIVAHVDGLIESIIVRKGIPKVKQGDMVTEGTVLVEGIVPIMNDDGTLREMQEVKSDADILLRHTIIYEEHLPQKHVSKEYTGRIKKIPYIRFGDNELFLGRNPDFIRSDKVINENSLGILEQLRISLCWGSFIHREYLNKELLYTREEASLILQEKLMNFLDSLSEKGVQIIEKNVKIEKDSQNWLLTGEILVSEPVNNLIPNENGALE